eukprot:UN06154
MTAALTVVVPNFLFFPYLDML